MNHYDWLFRWNQFCDWLSKKVIANKKWVSKQWSNAKIALLNFQLRWFNLEKNQPSWDLASWTIQPGWKCNNISYKLNLWSKIETYWTSKSKQTVKMEPILIIFVPLKHKWDVWILYRNQKQPLQRPRSPQLSVAGRRINCLVLIK